MHNSMPSVLITGGSGFFGGILKRDLLARGFHCVNVDLCEDEDRHADLRSIKGDIRDAALLDRVFREGKFDGVFHCAAVLAHAVKDKNFLWTSNVDGTRRVAEAAKKHGVRKMVFISSNCLWGNPMGRPIREDDAPCPVELYGRSKWEAEKVLAEYAGHLEIDVIRCCTIIDSGRLGLLSILFEFIDEGRKVWVIGGGKNVYQFIYAQDLVDACVRCLDHKGSGTYHIGSDNVPSFREMYESVVARAKTGARVASLPAPFVLPAMRIAYRLGLSPLGPYQYKMIAEDSVFDTSKIKAELGWKPTMTNEDMLWKAYEFYHAHRSQLRQGDDVPAHRQPAKMGIIRLLKWLS
jgi:UDP-glucose 4-epimerase